ncbi:MAG: hypothetical protein K5945_10620, partial [Bacteroidaceae bacterium]|nr:hypothetical protein [Bacteroidaceae bacterium]
NNLIDRREKRPFSLVVGFIFRQKCLKIGQNRGKKAFFRQKTSVSTTASGGHCNSKQETLRQQADDSATASRSHCDSKILHFAFDYRRACSHSA